MLKICSKLWKLIKVWSLQLSKWFLSFVLEPNSNCQDWHKKKPNLCAWELIQRVNRFKQSENLTCLPRSQFRWLRFLLRSNVLFSHSHCIYILHQEPAAGLQVPTANMQIYGLTRNGVALLLTLMITSYYIYRCRKISQFKALWFYSPCNLNELDAEVKRCHRPM